MVDNSINFEEYKLYLIKQYPVEKQHTALIWLSALKIHANITSHFTEKKKSEWNKLLNEVKNKSIK